VVDLLCKILASSLHYPQLPYTLMSLLTPLGQYLSQKAPSATINEQSTLIENSHQILVYLVLNGSFSVQDASTCSVARGLRWLQLMKSH